MKTFLLPIFLLVMLPFPSAAQSVWPEEFKYLFDEGEATDGLGEDVAVFDGTALMGAPAVGRANFSAGYAVFAEVDANGVWIFNQKVEASDGQLDDQFGFSVALYEDLAVIGAPEANAGSDQSGAAYVFRKTDNGWVEIQKLIPTGTIERAAFGTSVAVYQNLVLVGAPEQDIGDDPTGAAYIYEFDGDTLVDQQQLTFGDFSFINEFGEHVALSDNLVVIGTPNQGLGAQNFGAVYLFDKPGDDWAFKQELKASDAEPQDVFGTSVSVSGTWMIVGAPGEDQEGSSTGAAYVFQLGGDGQWTETQKLVSPSPNDNDNFAESTAMSGEFAVLGASRNDDAANGAGTAYVFEYDSASWSFAEQLFASDAAIGDDFGRQVDIYDEVIVAGAAGENGDMAKESVGAAYFFRRSMVGTANESESVPDSWVMKVGSLYPNPSQGQATVSLELSHPADVTIEVFDLLGKRVQIQPQRSLSGGLHTIDLATEELPAGVYLLRVSADRQQQTRLLHHMP